MASRPVRERKVSEITEIIRKYDLNGFCAQELGTNFSALPSHETFADFLTISLQISSLVTPGAVASIRSLISSLFSSILLNTSLAVDFLKKMIHKGNFETPVLQYDKEMSLIKRYGSIKEAANETKCGNGHIVSVCKGRRKTCGGFIWKYESDISNN